MPVIDAVRGTTWSTTATGPLMRFDARERGLRNGPACAGPVAHARSRYIFLTPNSL